MNVFLLLEFQLDRLNFRCVGVVMFVLLETINHLVILIMARKAFIVGVSTGSLKYCESDADLMNNCLERYGYDVTMPQGDRREILENYEHVVESSQPEDTVIVYFSGHGKVERNQLDFLLRDGKTIILNEIEDRLNHRCRARNKLLILDCCHAGKVVVQSWKSSPVENYLILTASEFLEESKEFPELRAGFFTYKVHEALTYHPVQVCPDGGQIQVDSLYNWLAAETAKHNSSYPEKRVPEPHLFGDRKANFTIGIVGEIQKLYEQIENLKNRIKDLEQRCLKPISAPIVDNDFEQMAQVRKKTLEILSVVEIQEALIRDSMMVVQNNYPNLTNLQKGLLEKNVKQTLNWLLDGIADEGFVSETEFDNLDQALLLQEPFFSVLEYIKITGIPSKTDDPDVVAKIRDYLDILRNKLMNAL